MPAKKPEPANKHEEEPAAPQQPKKGKNIIKKIGKKIAEKREEHMYKDEEWD